MALKITIWICSTIALLGVIAAITYSADTQPYRNSAETPQQVVNSELQSDYLDCVSTVDTSQVLQCSAILKEIR